MTKVPRPSLQRQAKRLVKKATSRQSRRHESDESTSTASDDTLPILPPTSSEESSENEEPPRAASTGSGSSSEYLSSVSELEPTTSTAAAAAPNLEQLLTQGVGGLLGSFLGVSVQASGTGSNTNNSVAPHISIDMLTAGILPSGMAQSLLSGALPEGLLPSGLAENLLSGNLPEGLAGLLPGLAGNMPTNLADLNKSLRSKNFSSGMMNMALLAANGNQLKYLLESSENRPLFIISVSLIGACVVIQIFLKVCLLISSRLDATDRAQEKKANLVNKLITFATSLLAFCTFCLTGIAVAEMKGIKLPAWLRRE